jgi:O-antigen ligase
VFGLAAANGGFFATAWGWAGLALLLVTGIALLARDRLRLRRLEAALVVCLGALVAWTALSALWSASPGTPLLETERSTLYLAAVAALLVTAARPPPRPLAAGVVVACVGICAWALSGRLTPDSVPAAGGLGAYRLAGPTGYWNGLGLLAAIGVLLALGFAAHADQRAARVVAAASTVVLVPTLMFTFSRGSWLALAVGLVALTALEPERARALPRLLAAAPGPALALWLAARSDALTKPGATLAQAERQGHRLGIALVALVVLAGCLALLAERVPAPSIGGRARRVVTAALAVAVLAVAIGALVRAGGPAALGHRAAAAFRSDESSGGRLNSRLLSASGSGRSAYWRVAWDEARAHPVLGGGAGSFGRRWLRERPTSFGALDAHELYLETLAELGPIGLLLLAAALAVPLVALRRARLAPFAAACGAAYVAFLVHAALDWDWELPAVGLAGLLCGAAVVGATPGRAPAPLRRVARAAALGPVLALTAFVFVFHVGNAALAASESARERGNLASAVKAARRAERWQPWSNQPPLALGEARLAAGDLEAAAAGFRKAIRRDPGDWEPWYQLGLATEGHERARALARASRLNPRSPELAVLNAER